MRVMIAGGGTGGHVYPGIAIYEAFKRCGHGVDVLFVGAKSGVEGQILDDLQLPHVLLAGSGVRGASVISKLTSPFVFLASIVRGIREIISFKPDVVIGTGGYASVAVVVASVVCGKKRVLQEQNSVPGLANRLLSRFAHLVLLSYQESRAYFGNSVPCAVVGNPLRFKPDKDRDTALKFLDLKDNVHTVLVFGGSRGAHTINKAACSAVARILAKREVQFVFLTGAQDYDRVRNQMKEYGPYVRVYPFLEQMQHAYAVSDIAVSRAGASAVFELASFGIPSIFVPYPYAADDHQKRNISELVERKAAIVIDNDKVDGEALEKLIVSLLDDSTGRREISERMRGWSKTDADVLASSKIAELVSLKFIYAETGPARSSDSSRDSTVSDSWAV
ncbi:MAG: undecaprenyldiphospho-muramoylpentapeptide beta-N-acetylglucosaminyltransferase [Candidatus Krumholzibacteria bacterium]|nr:undecaprenyldiphospho-muramoylpentapeptide beta-N-acetylglucosaminyltransferase [Candidatus Krumholzibacteria bacterium]